MIAPEPERNTGTPAPRPRDAATLIIYRTLKNRVEILMGLRNTSHKFLPDRYVFPGGGVERGDSRVRVASPISQQTQNLLIRKTKIARARGLVAAAIRETFEETGLIVGGNDPNPGKSVPKNWSKFFQTGFAPNLGDLNYIARAVTPHWRPIRFNARFFMVNAEKLSGVLQGNGELLNLQYFDTEKAIELELPIITKRVLELVAFRASKSANHKAPDPDQIVLFKHNGKYHDMIKE
ncbi:MAG: NUDIX hydrolase [Alphaproteobacteria bacterium]